MADRNRTQIVYKDNIGKPQYPKRKWWQHIPGFSKGFDDQLSQYQNDYNLWMWNKENKYNEPASQVDRWGEAGLSTNLMYGQGDSGNAGSGSPAERADTPTEGPGIGKVVERFMDSKMKLAQIKDVESAARLKNAQSNDLMSEMTAKDKSRHVANTPEEQQKIMQSLSPRERKIYAESITELNKAVETYHNARTAKEKETISRKVAALQDKMMIMQMVTGGLGTIARFF